MSEGSRSSMEASVRSVVEARGVSKKISSGAAQLTILDGVDLRIAEGERVAIVGSSGSGKTTLLSLLAGLDRPSSGEILLDGQSLTPLNEDARASLRAGRVGFVFQSFQLLGGFTAHENVMLPAELAGLKDAPARAKAALERVGLGARLTHYPYQLSGGEQQRVAIARAYSGQPRILFADEPTGNLDSETGERIIELLFELNRVSGTTLVLVTHDASLAGRCDRQLKLSGGRMVS
ncbi:MAG: putative transport system ATP-binding protein [Hydrocarboniphaga sp.]|uniref:ABC transporter ATP-binding protein n=1 Tax=Hydrocarboniphaga sp. TaxID=2033016 RepID=UPI00280E516B|nr:putative transport system ATP-binding protein [Hydrocarboniphaga sp.]